MDNSKHPVSELQERMARSRNPLPIYVMKKGTHCGFRCTVTVNGIVAEGNGSSKQTAKYEAAKSALNRLGFDTTKQNYSLPKTEPLSTNRVTVVSGNYIGALNELAAKKGLRYPKYVDLGLKEQEWVVKCVLTNYVTKGYGTQKKEAKQFAAKKMLRKLENEAIKTSKFNMKDKPVSSNNPFISRGYSRTETPASSANEYVEELAFETDNEEQEVSETESSMYFKKRDETADFFLPVPKSFSDETDDDFANSVAEKLRSMNPAQRELAQKLINKVLQHGLANELNRNSFISIKGSENYETLNWERTPEYVIFKCKMS